MAFSVLIQGCAKDHVVSRPTIENNPNWEMVENCGYEGCTPMVDFLSAKDIRIRIESFNHLLRPNLFVLRVMFVGTDYDELKSDQYKFNTSDTSMTLMDGTILTPKVFTCSHTIWDKNYLQSTPSMKGRIRLSDNNCFLLYFDSPPPTVNEEFTMAINGLTKSGQHVDIPDITFKNGISRW